MTVPLAALSGHAYWWLALVAAPAAHAVPCLGDVRELEVEPEGAQDGGGALFAERPHAGRERRLVGCRAGAASCAGEQADALDVGQQLLADLLDEYAAERISDQPDVTPERVVVTARGALGPIVGRSGGHAAKPRGIVLADVRTLGETAPAPAGVCRGPRLTGTAGRRQLT